jgi:hypothetical protein
MALGAMGTALPAQYPSTGVGNIGNVVGPANASAQPFNPTSILKPGASLQGAPNVQQLPSPVPQTTPQPTRPIGNIGPMMTATQGPAPAPHPAIASLHPQVTQALRSIPQSAWQQLARAGMIHPQLMQHVSQR